MCELLRPYFVGLGKERADFQKFTGEDVTAGFLSDIGHEPWIASWTMPGTAFKRALRASSGAHGRRGPTSALESDLWATCVLESLKLSAMLQAKRCLCACGPITADRHGSAEEAVRQLVAAWQELKEEQGGESGHGTP